MRLRVVAAASAAVALAGLLALAPPAWAAGSAYGRWTVGGGSGTLAVPVTGFPAGTLTTDSASPAVATSAFLGPATPFGAVFGSSRGQQYVTLAAVAGGTRSTTTVAFPSPTPAGWGFALGDVDADEVIVSGLDAGGAPVPPDALGFQEAFNYCAVSPRPPSCVNQPFTDVPTWDPATLTLRGNGSNDTSGAAGWFRPTVPLSALVLTFVELIGTPNYQLWLAALSSDLSGTVRLEHADDLPPPPSYVHLRDADGKPVRDADGDRVRVSTVADGSFTIPAVAADQYRVVVEPPPGYLAVPLSRPADARDGDVTGLTFGLRAERPPSTPAPGGGGGLPITGAPLETMALVALGCVAAGWLLRRLAR